MHPREPYDRRIELRESSFLNPILKSFLLVASIGALGGGGYFLARSQVIESAMFSANPFRQQAAAGIFSIVPQRQNLDITAPAEPISSQSPQSDQTTTSLNVASQQQPPQSPTSLDQNPATLSQKVKPQESTPQELATSQELPPQESTPRDLTTAAIPEPNGAPPQGKVLGASTEDVDAKLADLQRQIDTISRTPQTVFVPTFTGPAPSTPVSKQTFAQGQKIDQLSNTTITNPTITGGSISGVSVSASSLSGTIGVSQGGTGISSAPSSAQLLVGNSSGGYDLLATSSLGIAGGGGSASLTGSQGQVAYFSGTNTAVGTSSLFIAPSGNIGIGTTTPSANFVVNGTTGQSLLQIAASTNQNIFTVDQNGFVGIGIMPGGASTGDILELGSYKPVLQISFVAR